MKSTIPSLNFDMPIIAKRCVIQKSIRIANSVDPDETAHYEPSHQDLHCFPVMVWPLGLKWLIRV